MRHRLKSDYWLVSSKQLKSKDTKEIVTDSDMRMSE